MLHSLYSFIQNKRWATYQNLEADVHELRYLFWESTLMCNLQCRHCGSDCGRDNSVFGLPTEKVKYFLQSIASKYDASSIILVVTGGEPLVRPDLLEVLSFAKTLGFQTGIVTNGYILDQSKAEQLKNVDLDSIVVSLDGPEQEHDWLRNRRGSFKRAYNALKYLSEQKIPVVEAITCVTPGNLIKLEETYEIVKSSGAKYWRTFNIFPKGRAKNQTELLLTPEDFKILVEKIAFLKEKGKTEGITVNLSEEGFLGWDFEYKTRETPYFCRAGINIAGLMADGSFAACPNLSPWMSQGNIFKDDFIEVWENRYQIFRDRSWMKQGICTDCKIFDVCKGNSLHLWDDSESGPVWCHYKMLH